MIPYVRVLQQIEVKKYSFSLNELMGGTLLHGCQRPYGNVYTLKKSELMEGLLAKICN